MRFEFATATRVIFGPGTASEATSIAAEMGNRIFVVTGRSPERVEPFIADLKKRGKAVSSFSVSGEPTVPGALEGVQSARRAGSDVVIGIGGGSVVDLGKVIAALLTNDGDLFDYLEVIGRGKKLEKSPVPYIAVPTTSGTGAEVTRNAVLGSPEHKVKVSMRSPLMLPALAVVDPRLTYSMPPATTASTGLDALTQLLEVYVSNAANPVVDGLCEQGLKLAACSLSQAYEDGANEAAREHMALASLLSGMALANAKLGAVHGLAAPLGGMINAPHGVICARLLPYIVETNVRALRQRNPSSSYIERFDKLARILTGKDSARAMDGVAWIQELCAKLDTQGLAALGLKTDDLPLIVQNGQKAGSMKGNPIALTDDELTDALQRAM